MTASLLAIATALLARLGFLVSAAAGAGLILLVAPLIAAGTAWHPLRPLGLLGDYTPQTGGEP